MSSDSSWYPGRLEQGPEEKFGLFGFTEGNSMVSTSHPVKNKNNAREHKLLSGNVNQTLRSSQLSLPNKGSHTEEAVHHLDHLAKGMEMKRHAIPARRNISIELDSSVPPTQYNNKPVVNTNHNKVMNP